MCTLCSNVPSAPTCLEVRANTSAFFEGSDVSNTFSGAQAVAVSENVFGAIGVNGDIDVYSISLTIGQSYSINLAADSIGGNGLTDAFLRIYNSAGVLLFEDDDAGAGLNSYLSFTATYTGTVYVTVYGLNTSDVGDYYMSVERSDIAGSTATTAYIDENITLTGIINSGVDQDWYAVALTAGTTYSFNITTSVAGDSGLVSVYSTGGSLISNAIGTLQYTANTTGTFYVSAETELTTTNSGTYTIDVNVGSTGGVWDAPNLSEPLASIDWGHVVSDNNTGTAVTDINVYFVPGSQTFTDGEGTYTTGAWGTAEYNAALAAFQHYENVANVNFNVVGTAAQADFFMVEATGTGALGYFNVGGGSITLQGTSYTLDGHGVFDSGGTGWDAGGLAVGGYGYVTLIHELGHGMGLAHPHDNGGSSSIMDGVTGPFGSIGTSGLNQGIYTTMSYNDGNYSLYGSTGPGSNNYGWQGTLMALDLAVLHDNYGANTTFNNGNNTYTLPGANAAGTYYQCIWDTGGASDRISYTGALAATINLTAATLTGTAASGAGGFISSVAGVYGGFTIANGVVIEQASGGSGADVISGNAAANSLFGNSGADYLAGLNGADNLWGGLGADRHYGGSTDAAIDYARYDDANYGNLVIRLDAPNQNTGAAAGDTYFGIEGIVGGLGNDTIVGNSTANYLLGSGGTDSIYGGGGIDYLNGGAAADNLWGGTGADVHIGGDGLGVDYARYDDANYGNLTIRLDVPAANVGAVAVGDTYSGIEGLVGGLGNDTVIGNNQANHLFGGGGNDFIDGLLGVDYLNGGAGADKFRFSTALSASNVDTIGGFTHAVDDILLSKSIFAAIGATLSATEFHIGSAADNNDFLLYNNLTGQLFYDSNANAAGGMIHFATVAAGTVLDFNDFVMV